jgi:hypothetical protein
LPIKEISLTAMRRIESYMNSDFQALYEKILTADTASAFSEEDKLFLLKWAIVLLNNGNADVKKLGYRIALRYANVFKDYVPLYDISLHLGFYPVAKVIEDHHLNKKIINESFFKTFQSAYQDIFKVDGKYLSSGQKALVNFSNSVVADSLIVAPTSYGKSEIMINKVLGNLKGKVCIIVPSKALLAQTKRRLFENLEIAASVKRIITHPEMYRAGEDSFVAVLTQERLLRMLQIDPNLSIDHLLIDEAHNLLTRDERAELLVQVLLILKKRNDKIKLSFFTPFIAKANSLESRHSSYKLDFKNTKEFIKVERFFIYDTKIGVLSAYDQFINTHIQIGTFKMDDLAFIQKFKAKKNILYSNKPREVEEIALTLADTLGDVDLTADANGEFKEALKAISEYLDPEYKLLKCIKKGVIYHHGKVPELIRLYVESIYSKHQAFEFIATTSTLLEGVNIPAEKLFLLSVNKGLGHLTKSEFRNLAGRVCRFSETFSQPDGDLRLLEPEIYVLKGKYGDDDFNPQTFYEKNAIATPIEKDKIDNILLKKEVDNKDREKELTALEYIENLEPGTIDTSDKVLRLVSSEIAKSCFKNNVHEFDIHKFETLLNENLERVKRGGIINDFDPLVSAINDLFVSVIEREEDKRKEQHYDFLRLRRDTARNYYAYFLKWKAGGSSYKKMINEMLYYWEEKLAETLSEDAWKVYVGTTWGEIRRRPEDRKIRYIDLRTKSREEKINLAIVKIKDEIDFVDFKIMKFIDVLSDLKLLDNTFYSRIKYGTSNERIICLLKNGVSMELARTLVDGGYENFLAFDLARDEVVISIEAIEEMKKNNENNILIFELGFHVFRG